MKLVAFGCSHTFGWGLPEYDYHNMWQDLYTGKARPNVAPQLAYPNLLAEKLGLECDNRAVPGASCKEIMLHILEHKFNPTDTVTVAWTIPSRYCIVRDDVPRIDRIGPWAAKVEDTGNPINRLFTKPDKTRIQEIATSYYKDCYDDIDAKIEMHKNVQFAYLYLKEKVNDQYHFGVHEYDIRKHWSTKEWFDAPTLYTNIIADQKEINALEDGHPNHKGHEVIAQTLYNLIKESRT